MKGTPGELPRYSEQQPATGLWRWLGPTGCRRWWSRITLLACTAAIVLVWPLPIFMQVTNCHTSLVSHIKYVTGVKHYGVLWLTEWDVLHVVGINSYLLPRRSCRCSGVCG